MKRTISRRELIKSGLAAGAAVASGGAGKLEHLYEALTIGKASAVLAASIFHFGEISIPEAKRYLKDKGITVNI